MSVLSLHSAKAGTCTAAKTFLLGTRTTRTAKITSEQNPEPTVKEEGITQTVLRNLDTNPLKIGIRTVKTSTLTILVT